MINLSDYTVIEHLGHGAMGSVEKVRGADGKIYALKTLSPQLASEKGYVKRFKREAEIAIQLTHPNVVRVIGVGSGENDIPFILMEYVEGQTLDQIMDERGMDNADSDITIIDDEETVASSIVEPRGDKPEIKTFTPEETIKLGRQIAGVLQSAYDLDLLHRDIKPQNIMIDKRGNAKILDFGIAKELSGVYTALSLTGQAIGTPAYMSPEQYTGSKEIDIRSDLYSLGCTMYHMLTGRLPFRGATLTAMVNLHMNTYAEPVNKVNPECPLNLSQVIDRLLAKKPEDRHNTPAELIEDLNRVERGEVPLKVHKVKKSVKHNPVIPWLFAAVAAVAVTICFVIYDVRRSGNAGLEIDNAVIDAKQLCVKHDYDAAKTVLDGVINKYAGTEPDKIEKVKKQRRDIVSSQAEYLNKLASEKELAEQKRLKDLDRVKLMHEYTRKALRIAGDKARGIEAYKMINLAFSNSKTVAERSRALEQEKVRIEYDRQQNFKALDYIDKAYRLCSMSSERKEIAAAEKDVKGLLDKSDHEFMKLRCVSKVQSPVAKPPVLPKTGSGWTVPGLNMKLVYVPAGKFKMGTKENGSAHSVVLEKGFWLGKYEVSQAEYEKLIGGNSVKTQNPKFPVMNVSWHDAMKYCRLLTEREQKAGRLPEGYIYRLPTEAEWEYAARSGGYDKFSGSNRIEHVAWYYGNSFSKPHEVGTLEANELGLHDMSGNVWEWCLDSCDDSEDKSVVTNTYKDNIKNPLNENGKYRINRGGSWSSLTKNCFVSNRRAKLPETKSEVIGFRVAMAPEQ